MLYIVGTPIGNLGDITLRALETLRSVDFICAEDTRVTLRLLSHFDIKKPLVSYHEHNKLQRGPVIVERLRKGESCALVSDAGMPGISDPGEHLIGLCVENGLPYTVVPGPSAFVTGAVMSGFSTGEITFMGFVPQKKKDAAAFMERLKNYPGTVCIYSAPHDVVGTLTMLAGAVPDRMTALARELTKVHEEVIRGTPEELLSHYRDKEPRGEYVVIVGEKTGAAGNEDADSSDRGVGDPDAFVSRVDELAAEGMKRNDALKNAAKEFGLRRGEAYDLYEKSRGKSAE